MTPYRQRHSQRLRAILGPTSDVRALESAPTVASGEYSLGYVRIRQVLVRHLSSILVDAVLKRALDARGVTPASLKAADLGELTSDIMVGLRLFVPAEELPSVMLELAQILGAEES